MSRKVMVVGGSGFVGAYVVKLLLARGDDVVVFDVSRPSPKLRFVLGEYEKHLAFEEGSCTRISEVISAVTKHQIHDIIHLAALQNVGYADTHPMVAYEVNLIGTINILETARLLNVGRIVIGSTTGVYTSRQYEPMDEDHPIYTSVTGHPVGHYGASKAAADIAALTYYSTNNVDFVGVRLSNVYGFGMWAHMYLRPAVENLVKGLPTRFEIGSFEIGSDALFDYTYVKDAAHGIVLALDVNEKKLQQRIFLIGHGKLHSGADAVRVLSELEPKIDFQIGPGMTEMQKLFFRTRLDISKAQEQLGYQPQYDLRRGFADYISMQRRYEESREGEHD